MTAIICVAMVMATILFIYIDARNSFFRYVKDKEDFRIHEMTEDYKCKERMQRTALSFSKFAETTRASARIRTKEILTETCGAIFKTLVDGYFKPKLSIVKGQTMGTVEILETVDKLIDSEFRTQVILPRAGLSAKPAIEDVRATTDTISHTIIDSLSEDFFRALETHGFTRDFLYRYITRELFAKCIVFTKENRAKKES